MNQYYNIVRDYLSANSDIQFKPKLYDFAPLDEAAIKALANNLLTYRRALTFSQSRMAKVLGISLSQYKKYESGLEVMRADTAQKWALHMNLSFYHLLEGSPYAQGFSTCGHDKKISHLWFLANSLSDKYFYKLINILGLFARSPHVAKELQASGITRDEVKRVLYEIEHDMFVIAGYGLRAVRDHFQYKQEYIAELLGVSTFTYQQYEKPTMSPRFNVLTVARFGVATGIDPAVVLKGSYYMKVRSLQDQRMMLMREVVEDIDAKLILKLKHLVEGYFSMATDIPEAMLVDV